MITIDDILQSKQTKEGHSKEVNNSKLEEEMVLIKLADIVEHHAVTVENYKPKSCDDLIAEVLKLPT